MTDEAVPGTDPLIVIHTIVDGLPSGERRVARCILADPVAASSGSLSQLAERAQSSVSTTIRFCKRLGYPGFIEFRSSLTVALARARTGDLSALAFDELSPDDSMDTLADKLIGLHVNALQQTARSLDRTVLAAVAEALRGARHRMIFATAASSTPAGDLALKLNMLGLPTLVFDDAHKAILTMGAFDHRDVIVGMTYTGQIRAVGVVLHEARKLGARTVAITHELDSHVARSADHVLRPMGLETSQLTVGMATRTGQLVIGDLIFLSIAHSHPTAADSAVEAILRRTSSNYLRERPAR